MKNELMIKPLIEYSVFTYGVEAPDVFTAEDYSVQDGRRYVFTRTGNIVREYNDVAKVVARPANEAEIPV